MDSELSPAAHNRPTSDGPAEFHQVTFIMEEVAKETGECA